MSGSDDTTEVVGETRDLGKVRGAETEPLDGPQQLAVDASASASSPTHYRIGDVLGKGGMGEVLLAHDERVGRNVALKRMTAEEPSELAVARFLREAKIQARLEHPSIVPVHDLGHDVAGRPYFTMKRLAGTTLNELLEREAVSMQRLLRVFVDVCNAIEFAHIRGVVHRDIKPANIMVGNFGEVYVLDWGIARILDRGGPDPVAEGETTGGDVQTQAGVLVGTKGYMSPEQARGETAGPASDVYSLGAVLFEILTGQGLHPSGLAGIKSTLATPTKSPAACAPYRALAPELDAACVAALAADENGRPSAAILGERVQRYLDGDRDLERRRTLAAEQVALARSAADSRDPTRRAEAMQTAGRALALDPESRDAAAIVSALMLEVPAVRPPGLEQAVAAVEDELIIKQRHATSLSIAAYFLFLPIVLWMGVVDWPTVIVLFSMVGVVVVTARIAVLRRDTRMGLALVTHSILIAMMSRIIGPFVLVPALAGVGVMALIANPGLTRRRWTVIAAMAATLVVPIVLEQLHVLAPTWSIEGGKLVFASGAVALDPVPATTFLLASNLAVIVFTGVFAWMLASSRRDAILRAESQAWHLSQLLPKA